MPSESVTKVLRARGKILWHGQPRTDLLFVPADWFALFVVLAIMTQALFCYFTEFSEPKSSMNMLLIMGFLVVPAILFLLRFLLDLIKRKNSNYIVTDQRVIIQVDSALERSSRSVDYGPGFCTTLLDAPRKSTTIYFGTVSSFWNFMYPPNTFFADFFSPPAFMFVDNSAEIIGLILEANVKYCRSKFDSD